MVSGMAFRSPPARELIAECASTTALRDNGISIGTVSASALKDAAGIGPVCLTRTRVAAAAPR